MTTPGHAPGRPIGPAGATETTPLGHMALRLVVAARFASLLYLVVVVFLLLAAILPALVVGWQPLAVVSGSMQPAIRPGAMALVQPAAPDGHYSAPSIVTFHDPARRGRLITHRVVDTAADGSGAVSYATKGDANHAADSDRVPHADVVGAVRMVVPFVGLPALWIHESNHAALLAFITCSLLAVAMLPARNPT